MKQAKASAALAQVLVLLVFLFVYTSAQAIYQLENLTRTNNGYTGSLILRDGSGPFGGDFKRLKLSLFYETKTRVHLKIVNADAARWEVPNIIKTSTPPIAPSPLAYTVEFKQYPFTFKLIRLADNEVIFSTEGTQFAYADQYITIGTLLPPDANMYGVGERAHPLRLDTSQTFTIFNKDQGGNPEDKNLYGTQPFYMEYRKGKAHGVFFLNSNAMDFKFSNNPSKLQFITIGGVIDAYFFLGPTPEDVIKQYQEVVGFPALPPYWGLGFHQCRYGYKSIQETREVVQNYRKHAIPLDTMWNDIDYMDSKKIFTTDPVNYPLQQVQDFVKDLHDNNQQYVVIVDPGIKVEQGYKAYDDLLEQKLYVRANDSKSPIYNKVWPGLTIFPDFSDDNAVNYWTQLIKQFHDEMVPVDGLWIDMNELGTFCKGDVSGGCWDPGFNEEDDKPAKNRDRALSVAAGPNNPPYVPGGVDLDDHTLRMDAVYKIGIEYNVHNMYGYLESVATRQALEKTRNNKRAFIISRSNFAGSGYHVGHWTGDNYSTYRSMRLSIPGIINMNMFGVPLVGSDICGFFYDTTEELCTRWMQLGSFYPFSRNHNALGTKGQEPYAFGEQLATISRTVLLNRYSLLPYYYTLFYQAHTQGTTVMKALFMEFPDLWQDDIAGIDNQFMIGRALMVSPVLDEGVTSVNAYFPTGYWFDYYTGELTNVTQRRYYKQLDAPIQVINVHVRGGHIVPKQQPALTTAETRRNPFELLVALNATKMAMGSLFLDDGDTVGTVAQNEYTLISYSHQATGTGGVLNGVVLQNNYQVVASATLDTVTMYGITMADKICGVAVNGKQVSTYQFDASVGKLLVSKLGLSMNNSFKMEWVSKCL